MNFDIVIPSHHRPERLMGCLESIAKNFASTITLYQDVRVIVYFSDPAEYDRCRYWCHWFSKALFPDFRVPDFWNSHLAKMTADVMVTINDDIVLIPETLQHLIRSYESRFPDTDGVLGMNQINIPDAKDYSFLAIGKLFAMRCIDCRIFCPDYERFFADEELGQYAKSQGKFYFEPEARIIHNHASFNPELIDETHHSVRAHWPKDKRTYDLRQKAGFLWGRDFHRIMI